MIDRETRKLIDDYVRPHPEMFQNHQPFTTPYVAPQELLAELREMWGPEADVKSIALGMHILSEHFPEVFGPGSKIVIVPANRVADLRSPADSESKKVQRSQDPSSLSVAGD